MDRVLIDASHLRVGGGVQVAASFMDETQVLRARGTVLDEIIDSLVREP